MEDERPSRVPGILLITAMCLVGVCAVPSGLFFFLLGVHSGSIFNPPVLLGGPVLIAYVVAFFLWRGSRRTRDVTRAWMMAVVGLILIIGTAVVPVTILGAATAEEWRETQPGGRGYSGSR